MSSSLEHTSHTSSQQPKRPPSSAPTSTPSTYAPSPEASFRVTSPSGSASTPVQGVSPIIGQKAGLGTPSVHSFTSLEAQGSPAPPSWDWSSDGAGRRASLGATSALNLDTTAGHGGSSISPTNAARSAAAALLSSSTNPGDDPLTHTRPQTTPSTTTSPSDHSSHPTFSANAFRSLPHLQTGPTSRKPPSGGLFAALLGPASPPISPHQSMPGLLGNYFPRAGATGSGSGVGPGASPISTYARSSIPAPFRPTRRDLLVGFLSLSFAYLLFSTTSAPSTGIPLRQPQRHNAYGSYVPGWLKSSAGLSCPPPVVQHETLFGESVKMVGLGPEELTEMGQSIGHAAMPHKVWDEGEEAEEDDELESAATLLVGHAPGWTLMEKVYMYNGSLYVITDTRSDWPPLEKMISTGLPADNTPGNGEARRPKGHEVIFISAREALELWGNRVLRMEGITWLFNDGQFIDHYYHFAAELLMGVWRVHASLDPDITHSGVTNLSAPRRIWFLHQSATEWRDGPRFNPMIMYACFPSISMLYPQDWADLKNSTLSGNYAYVLDKAILADRSAAFYGPYTTPTSRTVASALFVGKTSRWWWEPIRRTMLRHTGVSEDVINRSNEGIGAVDPAKDELQGWKTSYEGAQALAPIGAYRPVITYISRQGSRRRLTTESHNELVKELEARAKANDWELIIVQAETMSKEEQIALAGRTTIMLGVHGNGLTHLIWMPATPRSAVIELYYKGGFARDYQWTAHALGIRHYGIAYDTMFTSPDLPEVLYPEGFQGTAIVVVGKLVVDTIEQHLAASRK